MTPPNPPPTPAEQLPPRGIERVAPKWVPLLIKALFLGCTISESLVILATRFQACLPFGIAHDILAALDPTRAASNFALTPLFLLGAALSLAGTAIRVRCYAILRSLFTFQLSIRADHHLITTGPYAVVRHPSYTGALLAGTGAVLCTLAPGAWAVECLAPRLLGPR
ncbi:hypothetical protein K438DRAFT_1808557, partial [Mycena galopus ATCC 62051]